LLGLSRLSRHTARKSLNIWRLFLERKTILMKRKNGNQSAWIPPLRQRSWIRKLLGEKAKPVPMLRRKRNRKAKALAAANRRAYVSLALGAAVAAALFAMALSVPPRISPEQLAADVKAQRVHKRAVDFSAEATDPVSVEPPPLAANSHKDVELLSTNNSALSRNDAPRYLLVNFEKLSAFRFFVTDQMVDKPQARLAASRNTLQQIPEAVKALNEKDVSLSGFMLPMKYEGKLTTEFLLLKNQSLCCYGMPPKIMEWVNVRVVGKGVKPIMDVPVTVSGVFHVGDVRENGELVGIYSLDAETVKGAGE
jgi:hypothetical protein